MRRNSATNSNARAVSYARVSSDEQEKEGFSIPAQEKLLREYAREEGIAIVREFVDVETAKKTGRRGFMQMVEFLKSEAAKSREERCRIILVEKTDRFYRNLKDYVAIDELDVDIHFVKENFILSPESHSSQKFMHGIKVLLAKQYVDNLGEEVKKGLREKARQGIWPSKAPTGYRNVAGPNGKRIIQPDPDVAPVVTRMFERYATGLYSLADVGKMAMDEGLGLVRDGNLGSIVHAIFRKRIYYGEFEWEGEIFQGEHTPLVTRSLWEKVQAMREQRRTRKRRRAKRNFPFSRLITCGHCGCALVGEIKKGKYIYYRCTGYRGKCPEPYVREEVLEEKFTEIIGSLKFDDEVLEWVAEALRESHVDEQRYREDAVARLQAEYTRLQRRIDTMYIDKLDGRISGEYFEHKATEWRDEQASIRRAIGEHEQANQSYMDEGIKLLELANRAAELFQRQPASEKRRLLDFVLSNSFWQNGELTPEFRQPFDMIADAAMLCATEKAAGTAPDDLHQRMLPDEDSNLGQSG